MLTSNEKATLLGHQYREEAEHYLRQIGYKHAGAGCFGTVFTREDSAIKMSTGRADGWFDYATHITRYKLADKCAAFPRIHWLAVARGFDGKPSAYRAEMEALQPITVDTKEAWQRMDYAVSYWNGYTGVNMDEATREALDYVRGWNKNHWDRCADLHAGNWMLRGDQLVLTDPIA
jgi:hypothetical protein